MELLCCLQQGDIICFFLMYHRAGSKKMLCGCASMCVDALRPPMYFIILQWSLQKITISPSVSSPNPLLTISCCAFAEFKEKSGLQMQTFVPLRKGRNHEAMSCLNMNECCVNASAVIFRQEQIPVCCCCVFSSCPGEHCCCYGILQGWKFSNMFTSKQDLF